MRSTPFTKCAFCNPLDGMMSVAAPPPAGIQTKSLPPCVVSSWYAGALQRIVTLRGSAPAYQEETTQGGNDFVWIPAGGGAATLIMPSSGLQNAHFVKGVDRIYASGGRGLVSFRWDGTDIKEHVRVSTGEGRGGGGGGGGGGGPIFM